MEIEIEKINKRNVIVLSNSINTIKHNLSAVALDILFLLFANIRIEDEEFKTYELTIGELNERLGRKINKISLKNALDELLNNEVYFLPMPEMKFTFLEICEHRVDDSILTIKLNDILEEHLLTLKKEFFKVNLDSFLKLKSKYSKILYCILCQYKNMKKVYIKFEDLKNLLDIPPTFRTYGNFKQRVLNPTIEALKRFEEFDYINFKEYKKIKSVYKIEFSFVQDEYLRKKAEKKVESLKLRKNKTKEDVIDFLENWSKKD
jgi:plasmid replication initiation protein